MRAPSVIIGVGGIGSQICSKVEEQLKHAKTENGNESDDNTRFVIIDTDINSIRELRRNGFNGKSILLTDNMTVSKCRDILHDPSIEKWYPENTIFGKKSMTEGAGQQRSISRLAFEYCLRDGRLEKLDSVVRELNELTIDDSVQQTRFYIISSLAGGTGSGVILPLAMYINRFIQGALGDNLAICKGFFILSSAFYAGCGSELEKKSLDANAYAAIKELSAFMRSADDAGSQPHLDYLPFRDIHYLGSTYEYCYLFGLSNVKARNIRSFEELKSTVANAVYMQALSPMHDRNSSREDNTVRHTAMLGQENQENWRRRFGGIGCGKLIYPYEKLLRYFGLRWAKDTMETEWRKYDEEYMKIRKTMKDRKRNKRGGTVQEQGEIYINSVDRADHGDRLAAYIQKECRTKKGLESWKAYMDALRNEAQKEIHDLLEQYKETETWKNFEIYMGQLDTFEKTRRANKDRYNAAEMLNREWDKMREELVERTQLLIDLSEGSLFRLHEWDPLDEEELPEYYLEKWLITTDGQFMHPNSVRYFLYQLKRQIMPQEKTIERKDPDTSVNGNKKDRINREDGKKIKRDFEQKRDNLEVFMREILEKKFMIRCGEYVTNLIKCYEEVYGNYDMILADFGAEIRLIEKELDQVKGVAYSYVCADRVCRNRIHEELTTRRRYDEGVISDISYEMFKMIHEFDLEPGKLSSGSCAARIKQFWCEGIEQEELGKEILDMNILQAMDKEEECKNGRKLTENGFEDKIQLVQDVLVAPFVQYFQRLDMNTGISLCCYNSSLAKSEGIHYNVIDWLKDHNAVDDDTYCSKRELMFYRSFVGLEAYEVLEYLHGLSARTAPQGTAFRSYEDMLRNMGRSEYDASKVMTPHADTGWHNLHNMPDPSKNYQYKQERYIAIALLYAYLSGKIYWKKEKEKYHFISIQKKEMLFQDLHEFHMFLYGNSYWYMELCRDMWRTIKKGKNNNEDCLALVIQNTQVTVYEILIDYWDKYYRWEHSDVKMKQLEEAANCILYACTEADYREDHKKKCKKLVREQIKKFQDKIRSMLDSHEIDENLARCLSDFLNSVSEDEVDDKFEFEMEEFYADFKEDV